MCCLTVKKDSNVIPHRDKIWIVVLCKHENRYCQNNEMFSPVISYVSLHQLNIMAIEHRFRLSQSYQKNALCNSSLPNNYTTIINPPIGCQLIQLDESFILKKTLYWVQYSPRHWFDKLTSTLKTLGIKVTPPNPCMYKYYLVPGGALIYIYLYAGKFMYLIKYDATEEKFHILLSFPPGFWAPYLNGPKMTKYIFQSISAIWNFLITHHNALASATLKGNPLLPNTATVSPLTPLPSQSHPQQIRVYTQFFTKS